jgi:ubiquinone/menaquinone biosynthesis C-methylase UbiE
MNDAERGHLERIVDQFSKQAAPFARLDIHMNAMDMLVEMSDVGADDNVLDVACGPGLVACEFAQLASHVTGIDITEAMIEKARELAKGKGLTNVDWIIGNAYPLPFPDAEYSRVITRYSFHHFLDPEAVFGEMVRVCSSGGRVLVADVCVAEESSKEYDRMERLRDDSHAHALTGPELSRLFEESGLEDVQYGAYGLDADVEHLLDASSHSPENRGQVLEIIEGDIGVDALGINARRENGRLVFTFPIAVFTGRKPG